MAMAAKSGTTSIFLTWLRQMSPLWTREPARFSISVVECLQLIWMYLQRFVGVWELSKTVAGTFRNGPGKSIEFAWRFPKLRNCFSGNLRSDFRKVLN